MEGRTMAGGELGISLKQKRTLSGTKRKSISSVVASVTSEAKAQDSAVDTPTGVKGEGKATVLPSVAPALMPYLPNAVADANGQAQQNLSAAILEDSL